MSETTKRQPCRDKECCRPVHCIDRCADQAVTRKQRSCRLHDKPAVLLPQGRRPPFGFRASAAATALSGLAKLGVCQPASADASTAGSASASASNSGGAPSAGRALPDHGASPAQHPMQERQRQQRQEAADQTVAPLRVLAAALADGAAELNASQLAQVQAPCCIRLN